MKKSAADEKQKKLFELIEGLIKDLPVEVKEGKHAAKATEVKTRHDFEDTRTGAKLSHVHLNLIDFIKISSLTDNFYQRKLQNHLTDKIYKNLIVSILKGHLVPELRIAVLKDKKKVPTFDNVEFRSGRYKVSIIDGLQRYCCFLIALYLAMRGEELLKENIISPANYQFFQPHLDKGAADRVLRAPIRLEIYHNLEITDLLKYMIIFNTAQKRMSINHQLEIMMGVILDNLKQNHKASFILDTESAPTKKGVFTGADLVLGIQAYIQRDHTLSKNSATDELFDTMKADESVVEDKIDEICKGMAIITNKLHPLVHEYYSESEELKYMNVLPSSVSQFLVPMLASLGTHVEREDGDQALIVRSLNRVVSLYKEGHDVFQLEKFYNITDEIKTSRGATIKNMVERGFRDFWGDARAKSVNWDYAYKSTRS